MCVLSVVIPTKNEEANIAACVRAFDAVRDRVEVIVVDNASTDRTPDIARDLGARVLVKGPERSAQRNLGWREATAAWVLLLDADMIVMPALLSEILERISRPVDDKAAPQAFWIPEERTGQGLRVKARNFERSFYDGTVVDALRLFRKSLLEATGGYDENLIAGPEDWDLDIRALATGARCEVLAHALVHNERQLSLSRLLAKKAYYSKSMAAYRAKWGNHPALTKQLGVAYRFFGVFTENGKWKRLLAHPVLAATMFVERVLVGATYLLSRR